jgi:hypothetical protein
MKMPTKDQIQSLIRELFAFGSAVLMVYGISSIGGFNLADITGFLIYATMTIWGVADKTNKDASAVWSLIRKAISMGGAFVMFYFPNTTKLITVLIPSLLTMINVFAGQDANAPVNDTKI